MLKGEIVILNSPPGAPLPGFGGRNVVTPASEAEASYFCRCATLHKCSYFQPTSVTTHMCVSYVHTHRGVSVGIHGRFFKNLPHVQGNECLSVYLT